MSIAGLFPGQGSQSQGMLSELAASHPQIQQTFAQASDCLQYDLWRLVQEGSEDELNRTENTQPIMLTADVAVWRVWQAQGGCQPPALAGHSLGEYAALSVAGVLDFTDALKLVSQRAYLMQHAVPDGQGAMAALLGLDDEAVIAACKTAAQGDVVEAVNFNAPGQVVIAGERAAVTRAIEEAKAQGARKAVLLPVSVPSHCALMQPAADKLAETLQATSIHASDIAVLHNVDARARETADSMRQALAQQLYQPVRWVETVQHLKQQYATTHLIEFGPGKVLTSMNRRIERTLGAVCVMDNANLEAALKLCEENP